MCGTVLAVSATLVALPLRQQAMAQSTGNPVLLPTDAGHTLDGGPAGWVSTAQVTATGCGSGSCPVAVGIWDDDASTGGVLRNTLSGSAGHSGVASVTWRSPLFVVPATAGDASFALSVASSYAFTPTPGLVPNYSVHLIDSGTGTVRTLVDSNPVPTPDAGLTAATPVALPAGTLAPGSVQRLEIVVTFPISARAGDASVALADPTLAVQRTVADTPVPPALTTPDLLTPATSVPAATPPAAPVTSAKPTSPDTDDPASPACEPDDVAVVGASGTGRTLSIAGTADDASGTTVDLLSVDGWLLGHTTVDARGRFAAKLPEPTGSAGTTKVFARLPDGRRSPQVTVQRRNVLRAVRSTSRGLAITGTIDPRLARSGRFAVGVELPAPDGCTPATALAATGAHVDRRTGAYRAVVPAAALAGNAGQTEASLREPVLVRAVVTESAPGRARLVTRSQVIFGPVSDRRGT